MPLNIKEIRIRTAELALLNCDKAILVDPPESRIVSPSTARAWGVEDLKDPVHQTFNRIGALTPEEETAILRTPDWFGVRENEWLFCDTVFLKLPGSPICVPDPLKGTIPLIKQAMKSYAERFNVEAAAAVLHLRVGHIEPIKEGEGLAVFVNGHKKNTSTYLPDQISQTIWHMDGGGMNHVMQKSKNPTDEFYIVSNGSQTEHLQGQGIDISGSTTEQEAVVKVYEQILPENVGRTEAGKIYQFGGLAVHRGPKAKFPQSRYLAVLNIHHLDKKEAPHFLDPHEEGYYALLNPELEKWRKPENFIGQCWTPA